MAGPQNSKSLPGRVDSTPFKALPGESLAPVGRHVPLPIQMSDSERDAVWIRIIDAPSAVSVPKPFPKDLWLFLALSHLELNEIRSLGTTCRALASLLLDNEALWRALFLARFQPPCDDELSKAGSWRLLLKMRLVVINSEGAIREHPKQLSRAYYVLWHRRRRCF